MKKFKSSIAMALVIASSLSLMPNLVKANSVSANLPGFNVTLNGQKVDYQKSQYPLLVYKDITYFPMTYDNTRFLGVETDWNNSSRTLTINKTGYANWKYNNYTVNQANAKTYPVNIPSFKINVNGKSIDNTKEEYPLIVFRDVTYFPLTWRFCVNEFGWKYDYSKEKGLVISSEVKKTEEKKQVQPAPKKEQEWEDYGSTVFYNGAYYVVKNKGDEYRLFKDAQIGQKSEQLSDLNIKSFTQDGDKLLFFVGDTPYYYDLKKAKVVQMLDKASVKDDQIIALQDQVFYVDKKDGELYNKKNKNISDGNKVETLAKDGDYFYATFDDDAKYKFIVYNKDEKEVYKSKNKVKDVKIEDKVLTFHNIDKNKDEEVKLDK